MVDKENPETWLSLREVREILVKESPTKWTHNRLFEEVDVAVNARLMPSDFWAASEQNRAFLLAYRRAKGTMEAYEHHLSNKEMKEQSKKNRAKGGR